MSEPVEALSATELDRLAALALGASPGPWSAAIEPQAYPESDDDDLPAVLRNSGGQELAFFSERFDGEVQHIHDKDAAYIAACDPPTVLRLIAQARRAPPSERAQTGGVGRAAQEAAFRHWWDNQRDGEHEALSTLGQPAYPERVAFRAGWLAALRPQQPPTDGEGAGQ